MNLTRSERRKKRHLRVRRKIRGTAERPRLCIRKTTRHLYAELVDDTPPAGCRVLASATTNTKAMKSEGNTFANRESARLLGCALAEMATAKGIQRVVFDRGGYIFHGIIKEFAEACRKAGLKF